MDKKRPHLRITQDSINERATEFDGGGSTYIRSNYSEHGHYLIQNIKDVVNYQSPYEDSVKDRYFISVNLAPGEKLKERYINLRDKSKVKILDVINDSSGYGVIKKQDLPSLIQKIRQYAESHNNKGKSYFSYVEDFSIVEEEDKISYSLKEKMSENPQDTYKVAVESFSELPKDAIDKGITDNISLITDLFGGKINNKYVHSSGTVVVECELTQDSIKELIKLQSTKQISFTTKIQLSKIEQIAEEISNVSITDLEGNPIVCIFDSGVSKEHPYLKEFIANHIEDVVAYKYDNSHGTFVASRVIYREDIKEQVYNGSLEPKCRVLDVCIFGQDNFGNEVRYSETELISTIRRTVRMHHENIRVYNLSISLVNEDDSTTLSDHFMSRIASELDNISKEYGVLFVIAAGNISDVNELLRSCNYPDHFNPNETRINTPAESFSSISVGSLVTKYEVGALGGENHPSPFSRRGPGFCGTLKPDLVVDGGNLAVSGDASENMNVTAFAVDSGRLVHDNGTSFSAPIISSYAAELFDKIPDASPNLVKALLLHFSNQPQPDGFERDLHEHFGFGKTDFNLCLNSVASKASFIHEGALAKQTYYKIPFWVPTVLKEKRNGRKKLRIRITLVWDPITDRLKGQEYSYIHINSNLFKRNENDEEVKVGLGSNVIESISYKQKFYPVARIEKTFERSFSEGLWSFELRMSHRWEVPEDYEQDFAVIVSVEDPNGEIDVYEEIMNEVGVRFEPIIDIEN